MEYEIKQLGKFKFVEEGEGEPLVLLHGLFGALSNFKDLIEGRGVETGAWRGTVQH